MPSNLSKTAKKFWSNEKNEFIAKILAQSVYLPESALYQTAEKALRKLSTNELGCLKLLVELGRLDK